jgi:hypothetical protein
MSNGRFNHNLNTEMAGLLIAQIGKSIIFPLHVMLLVWHPARFVLVSKNKYGMLCVIY